MVTKSVVRGNRNGSFHIGGISGSDAAAAAAYDAAGGDVSDREKWIASNSIQEIASQVVVGEAVKPGAAVAVAMNEKRRVVVQVKKEVYGVPYVAVSIPLEENGQIVGAVASRWNISGPCTKRQSSCRRLRRHCPRRFA